MSEKEEGKHEKEKDEEEEIILHHFYHKHPLTLTQAESRYDQQCYGCRRYIFSGETAYTCREKCPYLILHEECAEMPREITLSLHPEHTLVQKEARYSPKCAVCEGRIRRIGYCCSSSYSCRFQIHVGCARTTDIIHAAADKLSCMKHPSHMQHELMLLWRPGRSGSLRCDACGTIQKGNSYACTSCQYYIHESCAALLATTTFWHHAHPLSLVYHLPHEYIMFDYKCDMCFKDLIPKNWVYHCTICRYIVHIKCAGQTSPPTTSNTGADNVITFPINNAAEELIEAFVRKIGGMVNVPDEKELVKGKYKFHNPNHQLRLISSSSSLHDQDEEEEGIKNCHAAADEDEEAEEGDDLYHEKVSKSVCDVCTEPIILEKSSCSSRNEYSYISCSECKFFLHVACFRLPDELASSHTNCHPEPDHILTLQTRSKLSFPMCRSCRVYTNGLFYECRNCYFRVDIKCVSLPATIKHAAHHYHLLNLLTKEITREYSFWQRLCRACGLDTFGEVCYRCDTCGIIFHSRCCLMPVEISNRIWDKHPLRLTFDATVNHPGEFYCDVCEKQMNPKRWMYHCRECDVSVHPDCFPNVSGRYQNIKFGRRYLDAALHRHPLTFLPLTSSRKPRCDLCRTRVDYGGTRGFQCCSDECEFFVCFDWCHDNGRCALQAVE